MNQHFFYHGAVTSTVNNKMLISGSRYKRVKAAAIIDMGSKLLDENKDIMDLPDLNFGRYQHAMTVIE
jgi:hypothetical protein